MTINYEQTLASNNSVLARGGGGGSSSGGSGGGFYSGTGFSSGYSSSSSPSGYGGSGSLWPVALLFFGVGIIFIFILKKYKTKGLSPGTSGSFSSTDNKLTSQGDKAKALIARNTFLGFQAAWSDYDLIKLKLLLSPNYFKNITLQLNILKNYQRQNIIENIKIIDIRIQDGKSESDSFSAYIQASCKDRLHDLKTGKDIFIDNSAFAEIWYFVKVQGVFVLDSISQSTEDVGKYDKAIAEFASKKGFYFNPDFGWLMMPTRGAIFGLAGFGNADINNHVSGYYSGKIVEFYSYQPRAGSTMETMTIAQSILPKHYDDILVTEKSWYGFKPKAKGLIKVSTESNDFNKKFAVWAAKPDRATSFELLAPNFMEKIYSLNFEINIEVVDNVLYIYAPGVLINYDEMLEVLVWAFEEMKL